MFSPGQRHDRDEVPQRNSDDKAVHRLGEVIEFELGLFRPFWWVHLRPMLMLFDCQYCRVAMGVSKDATRCGPSEDSMEHGSTTGVL